MKLRWSLITVAAICVAFLLLAPAQVVSIPSQGQYNVNGNVVDTLAGRNGEGTQRRKLLSAEATATAHQQKQDIPVKVVVFMTIAMATAAGIGALPFFFVRSLSAHWSALATAVACGVMFGASFDLIHEGQPYGGRLVIFGLVIGSLFIKWSQKKLEQMPDVHFGSLRGASARRLVLMVGIMAAHALGEGCGVGVSFVGERGWAQGVLTTLAIGVHNVPEGLAKATVLVSQGASASQALLWSILTCLPQPLVAVPAFMFVETFQVLLPVALGFAAGCMIWLVFSELLPDAITGAPSSEVATAATLSAAGLEGLRMLFESLENVDGSMTLPGSQEVLWSAAQVLVLFIGVSMAAGAFVGGAFYLPPPLTLSAVGIICLIQALGMLLRLSLFAKNVPILHTVSGAVLGVAGSLVLRRKALIAVTKAAALASKALGREHSSHVPLNNKTSKLEDPPMYPEVDVEGAMNAAIANFHHSPMNGHGGGYNFNNNGMHSSSANATTTFDYASGPGGGGTTTSLGTTPKHAVHFSASSRDLYAGSGSKRTMQLRTKHERADSQEDNRQTFAFELDRSQSVSKKPSRRLRAPLAAATAVVIIGMTIQAVGTGMHIAAAIATTYDAPFGSALFPLLLLGAFRALCSASVSNVVLGPSTGTGLFMGCGPAFITSAFALISLMQVDFSVKGSVEEQFQYPLGLADTFDSIAIGALAMAGLLLTAVAMSSNQRHARCGATVGLIPALLAPVVLYWSCGQFGMCMPLW